MFENITFKYKVFLKLLSGSYKELTNKVRLVSESGVRNQSKVSLTFL